MRTILVPYHLDERLSEVDMPVTADVVVTAELSGDGFWARTAGLHAAVADAVAADDGAPAVVTGDCGIALGVVAGLQRRGIEPAVVWFDAHGDLHTPRTSTSGYPGGMPLRMLLGDGDPAVADRTGLRPVPAEKVVLVDGRDLDPAEAEFLGGSAVRRVAVDAVPDVDGPIYLHIDLDVVDAAALPGLRFPVTPGPAVDAVRVAALRLLATGRVAALTVACTWHPGRGAGEVARPLVEALLGARRGGPVR
ncbi:arginase family protein [Phytohabitans sp. LJ34]|uniref:arginase family protein n=1 Tax=Phytohabitans sp. LJ34 TaxID=3452217 RepID=UPI003F8A83CC